MQQRIDFDVQLLIIEGFFVSVYSLLSNLPFDVPFNFLIPQLYGSDVNPVRQVVIIVSCELGRNLHIMYWKLKNRLLSQLLKSLLFGFDSRRYVHIPINNCTVINSNFTATECFVPLRGTAMCDSPNPGELVVSGSSKIGNNVLPWIKRLTIQQEVDVIAEVPTEVGKEGKIDYNTERANEFEQGEEKEKEEDEGDEEEDKEVKEEQDKGVGPSSDDPLEEDKGKANGMATLALLPIDAKFALQTPSAAAYMTKSNVDSLPKAEFNSTEKVNLQQVSSSKRRRQPPNWKTVLESSESSMLIDQQSSHPIRRRLRRWWKKFVSCGTLKAAEYKLPA